MSTAKIDVYAAIVLRDSGNNPPRGVGSTGAPVTTISPTTSVASAPNQSINCAVGGTAVLFDITGQGSSGQGFECMWIKSTQPGTLAIKIDNDAGSAPSWQFQKLPAGFPFMLPTDDALTNSVAGTLCTDNAGSPVGISDAGVISTRIRRIVFYPDSTVTAEANLEVGRFA